MIARLSNRSKKIKPSFTLEMTSKVAKLRSKGVDVINFSAGQPDFNTPKNIINAATKAMNSGLTKYTSGSGMIELREAICNKLANENYINANINQVLVSNGEKQSLYLACQALFQQNDEVLIFTPYWVSFPEFVILAEATPIFVKTKIDKNFEPDFDDLKSKITPNTKGMIINTPSNPTGGVWSKEAIKKSLKIASNNNITVISDECYERLVFNNYHEISEKINLEEKINAQILTCMSMSKTYAMTGWRIGYTYGNEEIVSAMSKIQGQSTSCANSIAQAASIEALSGNQSKVEAMIVQFKKRRDLMVSLLNSLPDISCKMPGGAFYAFPSFEKYLGRKIKNKTINNSFDLSNLFLSEANIATVPGDGFGASGFVRFSFATSEKDIVEGLSRIKDLLIN